MGGDVGQMGNVGQIHRGPQRCCGCCRVFLRSTFLQQTNQRDIALGAESSVSHDP